MSDDAAVLDPPAPKLAVRIHDPEFGYDRTFSVGVIPFFMKLELVGLLGQILDASMSGPSGLSVVAILQSLNEDAQPEDAGTVTGLLDSFKDPDVFMRGIVKLVSGSAEHFEDLYCIMLAVPKADRPLAKMIMTRPEDEGGLSDDQGIAIVEQWMEKNGDVVRDFFFKRMAGAIRKGSSVGRQASSSSSSPTQQSTPRA